MNRGEIITELRTLGLAAGRVIMDIYRGADIEVMVKADQSPVTVADERADALIYEGLSRRFPDIPIVTEEQSKTHERSAKTFFIVDPLDGTKEFVKRGGDFTVNIALVEDGVPTLGMVYAPAKGRMFTGDTQGNALEERVRPDGEVENSPTSIFVAEPKNGPLYAVASLSHRTPETDAYLERYDVESLKSAGSSLKFCLVATGEADLYPRLGRTMEWDTAAGHAVLRAAGGEVSELVSLAPLTYGKPGFENPHFVAFAPWVPVCPE